MNSEAGWDLLDRTDRIRRDLPLEWAVGRLLGAWNAGSEPTNCPLPGHADRTPSFNLWAVEDRKDHPSYGLAQRWGCFGCGRNGDVIDLVEMVRGVGFDEACRIAEEELAPELRRSGWEPKPQEPAARRGAAPEDVQAYYDRIADMSEFGYRALERFCQAKAADSGRSDFALTELREYAVSEWGWVGAGPAESGRAAPVVAFPHRDNTSVITGVKLRDPRLSGGRWTVPGSRFPHLYGAWRATEAPNVLLCEGETDTVWAAWSLRDDPAWDVLGLPAGAGQRPTDEHLSTLSGRKTVYVAFDGDAAGLDAARRWYEALVARDVDARVCRLPEGEDVLSSLLSARQVVARATVPREPTGRVQIRDGVFATPRKGKGDEPEWVPIADFAYRPLRELQTDAGPAWDVRLEDDGSEALLRSSDLKNPASLTNWAVARGRAFHGPPVTVPLLLNWTAAEASYLPLEATTTRAGRSGRSYAWPGGAIGPERLRYVAPSRGDAKLEGRVLLNSGPFDPRAVRALETLNDEPTMATVLAWLTATLLRGRTAPAPALFVAGEAGAGKTVLLDTLLRTLGFPGMSWTLTSTTPYAVDCAVNSCVGFPVWFDEYRPAAREDSMRRLQQLLRDAYNGQPSMKGGMTQNLTELTEVWTWAGIVVSGEQGTYETSHADRLVVVQLDPDRRGRQALDWLLGDPSRWAGLGRALLEHLSAWALFRVRPHGPADLPDRFRQTLGFLKAGHDAWRAFRTRAGVEEPLAEPDWGGLWSRRSQAEDPWLEALRFCDGRMTRDGAPIVDSSGGLVRLLPYDVVKEAREAGIDLPAGARELITWLKRRYPDTNQPSRPGGGRRYWIVRGLNLEVGT